MKKHLIPESARDEIRACVEKEDSDKFATCEKVSVLWAELGRGIIAEKIKMEGWSPKEAEGRAHKWFLSSLAADAGLGYQSMLNRQLVGDSWIARGYLGGENENFSYQKIVALHANADRGDDGLVPTDVLEERIEWFYKITDDNAGQPPSVLDIQKHFRKNGVHPEWEQYWKVIVRSARKMKEVEHPNVYDGALDTIIALEDK